MDHDANKSFYFNPQRRVSQWQRPDHESVVDCTVGTSAEPTQHEWSLRRSLSMSTEKRGDWQAFVDAATQQPFYYNARTGESTWEKPSVFSPSSGDSSWIQCTDPATSQVYYLNIVTQQTSWEVPADLSVIRELTSGDADDDNAVEAEDDKGDPDYLICIDDDQNALDTLC
ncbi:hypothetical protein ATCC90586_012058 [Pythium insidiosum]|nr:hypothetical protein ATCC90586_012058 [Pythium insidiosum]